MSAAGSAQQIGRQYVTLDLKGVTLSVLFEEMMKQTDYRFFFNDAQEKNVKEVSISVKHVRVFLQEVNLVKHRQLQPGDGCSSLHPLGMSNQQRPPLSA